MVGVFLGSFDPPHIGHLSIVSGCLNAGISTVIVVPAFQNLQKKGQTDFSTRYQMSLEAFGPYGKSVIVSKAEQVLYQEKELRKYFDGIDPEKIDGVPTFVTLRYLQDRLIEEEIRIITTSETFPEIKNWIKGDEIYKEYGFILFSHPKVPEINLDEIPVEDSRILRIDGVNSINISSTFIRNSIKNNRIVNEFLPGKIVTLINKLNLYRK